MSTGMFLDDDEIIKLTGRKTKGKQIEALRKLGLAFFVNATGHPVVTSAAVEGRAGDEQPKPKWTPNVLNHGR